MQVKAWFGIFTIHENTIASARLFDKDIDAIVNDLVKEPLLLRGSVAGVDLRDLALNYGFVSSNEEYDSLLHDINVRLVKKQMIHAVTPGRQIIAAAEAIDDIDNTSNILSERLREWYMLNFNETNLKGNELARYIIEMKGSLPDLSMIQDLASTLLGLFKTRNRIEEYLKETMQQLAPNLTDTAGHLLGARLLCIAGSLERLAALPSSTIQVLGANNALFKHLRGKATSPKHGVIFRHPYVNTAPKWQRGKIARAVASKISLAARYDYYSGELKGNLREELEKKVFDIRKSKLTDHKNFHRNSL
jgi:nucleolar protein 56